MTPRAYWDQDGYLYESTPDGGGLRLVWSPQSDWAVNPGREAVPTEFGRRDIVEHFYGPLIAAA